MLANLFKKNKKKSTLVVTNRIISFGGETWAVRNITTVGKYKEKDPNRFNWLYYFRAIIVLAISWYWREDLGEFGAVALLLSSLFLVYLLWRSFLKKPKFALKLVSSAGESNLLTSKDEVFIDGLVRMITYVIQSDKTYNLSINVDNRSIYDNLKNVMIGSEIYADGDVNIGDIV